LLLLKSCRIDLNNLSNDELRNLGDHPKLDKKKKQALEQKLCNLFNYKRQTIMVWIRCTQWPDFVWKVIEKLVKGQGETYKVAGKKGPGTPNVLTSTSGLQQCNGLPPQILFDMLQQCLNGKQQVGLLKDTAKTMKAELALKDYVMEKTQLRTWTAVKEKFPSIGSVQFVNQWVRTVKKSSGKIPPDLESAVSDQLARAAEMANKKKVPRFPSFCFVPKVSAPSHRWFKPRRHSSCLYRYRQADLFLRHFCPHTFLSRRGNRRSGWTRGARSCSR
jgi:hypothetical protein